MPRKQRFKPSRKPKQTNEEVGKPTVERQARANTGERTDQLPEHERRELRPDDIDPGELERVNGVEDGRQG